VFALGGNLFLKPIKPSFQYFSFSHFSFKFHSLPSWADFGNVTALFHALPSFPLLWLGLFSKRWAIDPSLLHHIQSSPIVRWSAVAPVLYGKSPHHISQLLRKSDFSPWTLKQGKPHPWTFKPDLQAVFKDGFVFVFFIYFGWIF